MNEKAANRPDYGVHDDDFERQERRNRKRIRKLVKIAVADKEQLNDSSYTDPKRAIDLTVDEIYENLESGEYHTSTQILSIAFGLLNAHNLIESSFCSRIEHGVTK